MQPELNQVLVGGNGRYFIIHAETGDLLNLLPTGDTTLQRPGRDEQPLLNTIAVHDDWLLYFSQGRLRAWQLNAAGALTEQWDISDSNPPQSITATREGHWRLQLRTGTEIRDRQTGQLLAQTQEEPFCIKTGPSLAVTTKPCA